MKSPHCGWLSRGHSYQLRMEVVSFGLDFGGRNLWRLGCRESNDLLFLIRIWSGDVGSKMLGLGDMEWIVGKWKVRTVGGFRVGIDTRISRKTFWGFGMSGMSDGGRLEPSGLDAEEKMLDCGRRDGEFEGEKKWEPAFAAVDS